MSALRMPTDLAFAERFCALYLPLTTVLILSLVRRGTRQRFAACLLGFLWTMPALLALERLNQLASWWTYPTSDPSGLRFCEMPLELYAGWIVLWGILPSLLFPRLNLTWLAIIMAAFDLAAMPLCQAVVRLGPNWLVGEAAAVGLVLLPGLCLARWTERDTHLPLRAALQLATSGLLFLFFVPEVSFALRPGYGWTALLAMSGWQRQLGLELLLALALPGIGAVLEFFQRGLGTPIPYDPPKRLVTSGIYRYCANPMQISCTLTMALWAAMLRNPWLLAAPGLAVLYSAGIARWDERQDLEERFGEEWRTYREQVGNWIPRWKPYAAGEPARLYLASTCSPCSELRRWIERRSPRGLEILPAESLPLSSIQRMTYDPNDGSPAESGLRAMGRALEHLNLGWAMAGTALRLPGVWQFVQLLMDASGLGPRKLVCQPQSEMHSQRS